MAASPTLAQLGTFDPAFDGELWGARHELVPGNNGTPAGVLFVNGTLYVVDSANDTVIAYNSAGDVVAKPGAQWNSTDLASPVAGMALHALGAAVVTVNGNDRNAILISDEASNRVAAFDTDGAHLFTLRLEPPAIPSPLLWLTMGQVAMSPGAKFALNTATPSLTLSGTFAAGWYEQDSAGVVYSGAMIFPGTTVFAPNGAEFDAAPERILTGNENDPVAPDAARVFGVTFDTAGNLYALDAFTERLHVYSPSFERLFTFGTPVAGGGTADFYEPWGLAYWPDANGGRVFVNDTYNGRILVYRPIDTPSSAPGVDALHLETVIKGFVAPVPKISLFAIAVDPSTGSIAVTDFADWGDGGHPRAVVLQQPNLAAFDLQLLDAGGAVVQSVCAGADYKVRFSLTVPPDRAAVTNVLPTLLLNGVATAEPAVPAAAYPSPLTLSEGQVATFTYNLTAGAVIEDIVLFAGATGDTADILGRAGLVFLADCAGETDPSTLTATPNFPPQVSGWTPVPANQAFSVRLDAEDQDGIASIEYQIDGTNFSGDEPIEMAFDGVQTTAGFVLPLPEYGRSTLRYRVRDGNGIWSPLQTLNLRPTLVVDRIANENIAVEFRVGDPEGTGITYSVEGLPAGVTFASNTGQFAGVVSFDAVNPYSSNPIIASGVYPVVVTETGPGGETSSVGFTWTINHVNRPPIITNPPVLAGSLTINQGALFSMQINGLDPDGDPAVFTFNGRGINEGHVLPPSVTIDPVTGLISGVFPPDSDPAYDFSVGLAECSVQTATPPCNVPLIQGSGQATFFNFQVAVLDVNEPAVIANPGAQTNAENDSVSLAIQVSDPDGDPLTFDVGGLPPGLSLAPLDSETVVISGTVAWGAAGTYAVTVRADDHVNELKRSVTFSWVITHKNRPPTLVVADKLNFEGGPISDFVAATDPDAADVLTYSVSGSLPPGVSMSPGGVFSGAFDYQAAGAYPVTIVVSDGTAQSQYTFLWTVLNVNRPPTLVAPARFNAEGDSISVSLNATDPDGDSLAYTFNGLPVDLSLNPQTGVITGTFSYTSAGVYTVNVAVFDGETSVLQTFVWTITETNRPPVVAPIADKTNSEGDVINLPAISVTDPDGDSVFAFTATNLPPGLTLSPLTGAITGTLPYTASGTYAVSIAVSDGKLANHESAVTFTWTVLDVNRPPTVTAPDLTNAENDTVSYSTSASDPDGAALTYSATGLPPGISIDAATGALTGTLGYTTAGTYNPTITVTDGSLTASAPFVWLVTNLNAAPVITTPGNLVNNEGETISLQIAATDVDTADTLTFTATGVPPGLSISSTGLVTGVLPYTAAGSYSVTVTVSDGTTSRSVTFRWTVNNVNRPPDVTNPGTQSSAEGTAIALPITAADPDGEVLAYTASGLPAGLSINALGVIAGTIEYTASGTYTVTVTASDGALSDSETFTWAVTNVNRAPSPGDDFATVTQGQSVIVNVRTNDSDPDGQNLTVTNVTTPSSGTVEISGGGTTVTYTAAATYIGPATFSYTISDGTATATATVTVTVLSANAPPVCTAAAATPGSLWPPNHKPEYLSLSGITDPEGRALTITFTSVMQDESTDTTGDGHTTQDAGIEEDGTRVWVRAERRGDETAAYYGRVYIVGFTATDDKGASCSGTVFVGVPHDQGNHNVPIPGPGRWNSITGALVVAPPPTANNDSVSTKKNAAVVVAVQSNDVVYGAVTLSIATAPASGTGIATVNPDGTITYTPPANWEGSTSFTYRLTNGAGSDTAVVSVTVKK